MTAEDYLRRLVANGCEEYHCDGYDSVSSCSYCEGPAGFIDEARNQHKPDCPFDAAVKYLAQADSSRKALKELADSLQDFRSTIWG